jgi:alkylation response protein AidB-like acyl-CoA dehydrogenase
VKEGQSGTINSDSYFSYPKEWLDAESEEIAESVRRWADNEVIAKRLQSRENFEHQMRTLVILAVDIGLHRLIWPEEMGGVGFPLPDASSTLVRAYEEIGRADPGIGYISAANIALAAALTEERGIGGEMKKKMAAAFCDSEDVELFSLILPGLGDINAKSHRIVSGREVQAELQNEGNEWVLRAERARPFNSGYNASVYGVFASLPEGLGFAFVKADKKGVERGELLKTTGLSASLNADVRFRDVRLSSDVVTPVDESFYKRLSAWMRLLTGSIAVGSAIDVYRLVKDWADNRVIKGKGLLRDNPMDAAVLAQVAMDIVDSRLLIHNLARAMAKPGTFGIKGGDDIFILSGIISVRVLDNCMHAINRAMEMMGSAGYSKEWHVEKHWRDLKTMQVYLGGRTPVEMDVARYYYGSDVL